MRPTAQQGSFKCGGVARLVEHLQHRAHRRFFADLHVRHHLVRSVIGVGQHPLDQQLQLPATGLFAKQTGGHHLRVVEHQQVAGLQQAGQVFETAVDEGAVATIQQTRRTALGRRCLSNQFRGEVKVEVA